MAFCRRARPTPALPTEEGLLDDGQFGIGSQPATCNGVGPCGTRSKGSRCGAIHHSPSRRVRNDSPASTALVISGSFAWTSTLDVRRMMQRRSDTASTRCGSSRPLTAATLAATLERTARRARHRRHRLAPRPGGPARCRHGGSTRCTSRAPAPLRPARGGRRAHPAVRLWPARRAASASSLRRSRDEPEPGRRCGQAVEHRSWRQRLRRGGRIRAPSHRRPAIRAIRSSPRAVLAPRTVCRSR